MEDVRLKLNNLSISIFIILLMATIHLPLLPGTHIQYRLPGARFYYITSANLQGDAQPEVIAAGQIQTKNHLPHRALIMVMQKTNGHLHPTGQLSFAVPFQGKNLPARIRAIQIFMDPGSRRWHLISVGRGGGDEQGVGFLHHAVLQSDHPLSRDLKIFHSPGKDYTHGYPLAVADLDGDQKPEIIYGGFVGDKNGDRADVRTFNLAGDQFKTTGRLFTKLAVAVRVNALISGDISGDGKPEVIIAGRVKMEDGVERSAFAWTDAGKSAYHIFDEKVPCRLRTLLAADINNDGKKELITGGRLDGKGFWLADLRVWRIEAGKAVELSRFNWTHGHQIRLRALAPDQDTPHHLWVGGRAERRLPGKKTQWQGFIWKFALDNNHIRPLHIPPYLDLGSETRVRHLHLTPSGNLVSCGFGKGKPDYGFVLYQ
jgi:hypothetical protein